MASPRDKMNAIKPLAPAFPYVAAPVLAAAGAEVADDPFGELLMLDTFVLEADDCVGRVAEGIAVALALEPELVLALPELMLPVLVDDTPEAPDPAMTTGKGAGVSIVVNVVDPATSTQFASPPSSNVHDSMRVVPGPAVNV